MSRKINLNRDWRFHLGDEPGADFMGHDDRAWRHVTLPHDWSVEHPFDRKHASGTGYLPGGTAWYRRHFVLEEAAAGKRVRITFGGAMRHARVWVNSNHLGQHAFGYGTFTFDVTDFVRPGENVISVRVEHDEVADSRWFTGSGIYRDVTLEICEPVCFAENGVFAVTESVDDRGTARLRIAYETLGAEGASFLLYDAQGRMAASAEGSGMTGSACMEAPGAALWSPENPVLYTLVARTVKPGCDPDEVRIPIGVRTFRFDPDEGFFLNGVNMKIKGVCVHHDAGALGAAVPREVWERRLRKLKECGCNAIRTAHNPPDTHLLDLCDELGFLVMDEAFDEWEGTKNKWWQGHNVYPPKRYGYAEDFPQWHEHDLTAMVKRDRNHPSIIIWSIGNEVDYPNDPYVTPLFAETLGNNDANKPAAERVYDPRKPDARRLVTVARELTAIVHGLDTSRPVTSALSFPELSNPIGLSAEIDIAGYNYKEQFYAADHELYPDRVIYGSENSKDAAAWYAVRDNPYICGQFLWTGVDFLGECPGWPIRISRAGLLDLAGYEKPNFLHRTAMWTEAPYVRLTAGDPGCWMEDERMTWSGTPGETRVLHAYTNAAQVAFRLNGQSLGTVPAVDYVATLSIPYEPGEVTAVIPGAQDVLATPGPAVGIRLEKVCSTADVAQVEATLLDAAGRIAADDDQPITWQPVGSAELLGIENGAQDDLTPYASATRRTRNGRAIVYVRLKGASATLYAHTPGGITAATPLN